MTSDGRGQGDQRDEDLDEALHAPRQIRQRGRGHRHEHGDLNDGEAHVVVVDHDPGRPSAAAAEQDDQDPARRRRAGRAQPDVARDLPPPCDQGQHHQDGHDAERARLVHHGHQPGDAPRWRMDHLGDGPVDPGVVPDDEQAAGHGEDGDGQADAVASAPATLAAADRGEYDRAPAPQEMLLRSGALLFGEVPGHTAPVATQAARTLAFSRSNSSAVMTPRSRRSASLASWSAEFGSPAACWM